MPEIPRFILDKSIQGGRVNVPPKIRQEPGTIAAARGVGEAISEFGKAGAPLTLTIAEQRQELARKEQDALENAVGIETIFESQNVLANKAIELKTRDAITADEEFLKFSGKFLNELPRKKELKDISQEGVNTIWNKAAQFAFGQLQDLRTERTKAIVARNQGVLSNVLKVQTDRYTQARTPEERERILKETKAVVGGNVISGIFTTEKGGDIFTGFVKNVEFERGKRIALDNPQVVIGSENLNKDLGLNLDSDSEIKVRNIATETIKDKDERVALLHKTERDQADKEYLDLALKGDRRGAIDLMVRKRDEGIFTAVEAGKKVDAVNDGKFELPSDPLTLARTKELIRVNAGLLSEVDVLEEVQRNPRLGMKDLNELQTLAITARDEEYRRNSSSLKAELEQFFRGFALVPGVPVNINGKLPEEIESQALDEFGRTFKDNLLQQDPTKRIPPFEIKRRVFEKVRNEVLPITEEKARELTVKFQDDTPEKIERDLQERKISTKDAEVRLELLNRRGTPTQPAKKGQAKKASSPFDMRRQAESTEDIERARRRSEEETASALIPDFSPLGKATVVK